MPRSPQKRASAPPPPRKKGAAPAGGRLQVAALFVTIAAVGALLASLGYGIYQFIYSSDPRMRPPIPAADPARPAAAPPATPPRAPAGRVRVQVLNATGTHGLARTATDVLRDRGFDVVETGNAPRGADPDASLVLDRVGNRQMAEQVALSLGIARVETRRDPALVLDVTVILGKDWTAPAARR